MHQRLNRHVSLAVAVWDSRVYRTFPPLQSSARAVWGAPHVLRQRHFPHVIMYVYVYVHKHTYAHIYICYPFPFSQTGPFKHIPLHLVLFSYPRDPSAPARWDPSLFSLTTAGRGTPWSSSISALRWFSPSIFRCSELPSFLGCLSRARSCIFRMFYRYIWRALPEGMWVFHFSRFCHIIFQNRPPILPPPCLRVCLLHTVSVNNPERFCPSSRKKMASQLCLNVPVFHSWWDQASFHVRIDSWPWLLSWKAFCLVGPLVNPSLCLARPLPRARRLVIHARLVFSQLSSAFGFVCGATAFPSLRGGFSHQLWSPTPEGVKESMGTLDSIKTEASPTLHSCFLLLLEWFFF